MNQQLLEASQQIASFQVDRDKATLKVAEERKKNAAAIADPRNLRDELAQYKAGEEERWGTR